jgi:hypothetical protein
MAEDKDDKNEKPAPIVIGIPAKTVKVTRA